MTSHSHSHSHSHGDETPAGGFFERPPPVRPRTQGHKHRARTASGKRPGTRGGSSQPTSARSEATPPRRPFTPGDSAQAGVRQILGAHQSAYHNQSPAPGPGWASAPHKTQERATTAKRVDRFGTRFASAAVHLPTLTPVCAGTQRRREA